MADDQHPLKSQWRTVLDVNLTGQFLCVREAIRRFLAQELAPVSNKEAKYTFGDPVCGLSAQHGLEISTQRMQPNVLHGDDGLMDGAFFAATCGLSDVDPVGGLVASAAVAWKFDEGLQ